MEVEWGLSFASVFAGVLAFIIIANTFLMKISERRPQIAILRAVGATRRQIVGMMLREALLLGIVGTLLGCAVGLAGGYLLMVAITRLYVDAPPPVILSPLPFVLALVFGPAFSLAAAAVPTWAATRVTPLEAMRPSLPAMGPVCRGGCRSRALPCCSLSQFCSWRACMVGCHRGCRSDWAAWPWPSSCS